MSQQKLPSQPKIYATQYRNLLGVDFQRDVTDVDKKHSPNMVNMISDVGGNPVKRSGYRKVGERYEAIVQANQSMYGVRGNAGGTVSIVKLTIKSGQSFVEGTSYTISFNCGDVNGVFAYQTKIYILCERCFIEYDAESNTHKITGLDNGMMCKGKPGQSEPTSYDNIPTTLYALKPNGTSDSALTLDDKSIFNVYQKALYAGDGTSKEYKIPTAKGNKIGSFIRVEVMNEQGIWQDTTDYVVKDKETVTGLTLDGTTTDTFEIIASTITFVTAPSKPTLNGEDNVRITFAPFNNADTATAENGSSGFKGYYNERQKRLLKAQAFIFYSNRLFLADGDRTYYSDVNNPLVVSDLHYFEVDNQIIAYTRTSSYLAIITKDCGRNTIFLASPSSTATTSGTTDSTLGTDTAYSVKPSNAGVGAISKNCAGTLNDEPLFLASTGIYGIQTNWLSEKYAINRSARINRKLCKEPSLENAVGISWNYYFFLAINKKMYILDGRHAASTNKGDSSYECYYFENMPHVKEMYVIDNVLYFTDVDSTYRFNDDLDATEKFYDDAYEVNGEMVREPVKAMWSSTFDDDGSPQLLKTLNKKGSMVTLQPFYRSGCSITLVKDGDVRQDLGFHEVSRTSFANIDFTRFTFQGNQVGGDIFTKKKVKKYKRLQIILRNDNPEPFGITNVVKSYTVGNYAKK